VVVYAYNSFYFRHFSDGDLNRYELVTLNVSQPHATFQAQYQYVPASQLATLNVIAQLPNGTQIGTTVNSSSYIQHTPGLWLTVAPLGMAPFTGTSTGGSLLPFDLFGNQYYTIQMTDGFGDYHFAYWQDNANTNGTRTIDLTGNQTYIAVYNYVS
jgi:hypothetical protein